MNTVPQIVSFLTMLGVAGVVTLMIVYSPNLYWFFRNRICKPFSRSEMPSDIWWHVRNMKEEKDRLLLVLERECRDEGEIRTCHLPMDSYDAKELLQMKEKTGLCICFSLPTLYIDWEDRNAINIPHERYRVEHRL